jgi:ribosomal protein S18 acetylase RimI-like enzyme
MYKVLSNFSFSDVLNSLKSPEDQILGKFAYDKNIPHTVLLKKSIAELKQLEGECVIRLALECNNQIFGIILIIRDDYDSEHFGINVGKTRVILQSSNLSVNTYMHLFEKAKKKAAAHNLDVLFIRVGLDQIRVIQSLEKVGAFLTDVLITFHTSVKSARKHSPSSQIEVVEASNEDEQKLTEIAQNVFKHDQYHSDPRLPVSKCNEFYAKWISNSLNRLNRLNERILLAREKNEILGFIICRIHCISDNYNFGVIDLIGVHEDYQRKGIGFLLVTKALDWFSKFTKSVYVGTQATNVPAVRLYQKANFKQVFSEADFHLWL